MKTLKLLLSCTVFSGLMTATLRSQPPAVIKIDLDRKISKVDPNIYGAFVEPIRTVVYGSIYDPKSPFADENGFKPRRFSSRATPLATTSPRIPLPKC